MQIINTVVYRGKNIYSYKPMIKITVDLGDYYDTPTNKIDSFNERLINYLPGIRTHKCSTGVEGGFVDCFNLSNLFLT